MEFSIVVTESGIVILVRLEQFSNAEYPIFVTELGIVILVRLEQPENVNLSILLTELGIIILVRLEQPKYVDIIGYQLFVVNTVENWMCFLLAYGRKPRFNVFNLILQEKCEFEVAK